MKTGDKLLLAIESRGISQSELARRCGYAQSKVNAWVNGKGRMYADQAYKICKELGVSTDWLLDEEGNEALPVPKSRDIDLNKQIVIRVLKILGYKRALKILLGVEPAPLRGAVVGVDGIPDLSRTGSIDAGPESRGVGGIDAGPDGPPRPKRNTA